jgi:FkbH-like protein
MSKRQALQELRSMLGRGEAALAWHRLGLVADPADDLLLQTSYAALAGRFPPEAMPGAPIRVALLGSSTLEHLEPVLRFWLARTGLRAETFRAPYDTIQQTVLDADSELYRFEPDVVWIFTNHRDLRLDVAPGSPEPAVRAAVERAVDETRATWRALRARTRAFLLQNNADLPPVRVFGNLDGAAPWGRATLLRRYNVELTSALPPGTGIFDLDAIAALCGAERWTDARYWHHSKHAFAPDATGWVAFRGARWIGALRGLAKKVLVLDLDNTLWGGVVGDDGVDGLRLGSGAEGEAFVAFQDYVRALGQRGVVLAVSSKNEEAAARAPFLRHPDMRLTLDHFAMFRANWRNKADNLREIAQTLNLGLDSLVFVDDNPAERALVRELLPMVAVPELPEDPSDFAWALDRQALFETVAFSDEDRARGQQYRENAQRDEVRVQFTDLSDYLASLQMASEVGSCDGFHLARMAQLVNKSNQFHLTGTRYSEGEIAARASEPAHDVRYFKLRDRFGDNGLISVVITEQRRDELWIDTWVMSCRVLARGMEEFIARELTAIARDRGCRRLVGRYVPSSKNQLVAGLYPRLGFAARDEAMGVTTWQLELADHGPDHKLFIQRVDAQENPHGA